MSSSAYSVQTQGGCTSTIIKNGKWVKDRLFRTVAGLEFYVSRTPFSVVGDWKILQRINLESVVVR